MNPQKVENSYIGFIREEDNEHFLFYPTVYSKPHFMNGTVHEIWDLCNGQSMEEIAENLKKRYKHVPFNRLLADTRKVVLYLKNLGMLEYEGEEGMMSGNGNHTNLKFLDEEDFVEASLFIKSLKDRSDIKDCYLYSYDLRFDVACDEYYKAINIRTRQLNRTELYFQYIVEKKISGLIGISISSNAKIAYITTLLFEDRSIIGCMLENMESILRGEGIEIIKIRMNSNHDLKKEMFVDHAFRTECILKKESAFGEDIIILAKEMKGDQAC